MIIVLVEYDEHFIIHDRLENDPTASVLVLTEIRDAIEAITGLTFAEEQSRVDVRLRAFGRFDQYEEPIFITIDVAEDELPQERMQDLSEQFLLHFGTHIDALIPGHIPFRLWVRRIPGSFVETART